ncbi:hypothetical protein AA21952_0803 [Acetobacter oeni LMG 21952]|nr:hypothetical protein AA21952_0803 [Acetobacter oeni LMG 21952]
MARLWVIKRPSANILNDCRLLSPYFLTLRDLPNDCDEGDSGRNYLTDQDAGGLWFLPGLGAEP